MNTICIKNKVIIMVLFFLYPRVTKPCENNQLAPVINQTSLTLSAVQNTIAVPHNTKQRLPDLVVIDIDPHVDYTVKKHIGHNEGVVGQDFIFLNTLARNITGFNNNNQNTFYPESVKLSQFAQNNCCTKDFTQYEYEPKDILAFYNTPLCMGMQQSKDLSFCIATELLKQNNISDVKKHKKVYLVLPACIKGLTKDTLKTFFTEHNKSQNVMCLQDSRDKDYIFTQQNDNNLLKIHLYMPKINDLNNVIFYAFLLNKDNILTNSIDIARFSSIESFKKIYSIDEKFVQKQIIQYFNTNIDDLFYMLYTNQNRNKNQVLLTKDLLSNINCEIFILDTICKKYTESIKAEFLIKIMLSSTIVKFNNAQATVPHFYGLFTTYLSLKPEAYTNTLAWESTFFTIQSTEPNGFNQPLFFAYDKDAMPRNDVRNITVVASTQNNDSDTNNPIVELITGINDQGFMTTKYAYNDVPQLSYNNQSNKLALTLPAHPSNKTYVNKNITFSSTELLTILLDNVTKQPTAKQPTKTNASTSFEPLFTFASGLIQQIELLQKHIHLLEEQITNLSMQHNDLFLIKKEIALKKQSLDATLLNIRTQIKNLKTAKKNTVKQFQEACKEKTQQQITQLKDEIKNLSLELEKLQKSNVEELISKCQNSSLEACKNPSITKLNKSQRNYFLTGIGSVYAIGILVLCCYLYKLHTKINALESFINQNVIR